MEVGGEEDVGWGGDFREGGGHVGGGGEEVNGVVGYVGWVAIFFGAGEGVDGGIVWVGGEGADDFATEDAWIC